MTPKGILTILVGLAIYLAISGSVFVVDETEQVVLTRFGSPLRDPIMTPGLNIKWPMIDKANYFPKSILEWEGTPGQIPTLDKTFIGVDTFARWRIIDPLLFFQRAGSVIGAQSRLDDILDAAVQNYVTSYPLIETVRMTDRKLDAFVPKAGAGVAEYVPSVVKVGREKITEGIMKQAQPKLKKFGLELVDVKIKRINYVQAVQEAVFARMIAERKQIAEKFRAEGTGEARKIEGDREKELQKISSEAYRVAQEIMGQADAESTRICAQAFNQDPEFYSFLKTLEVYKETFDDESSVVFSTDSDFFKYLKGPGKK